MKGLTGPQNEVLLKARRVAKLHVKTKVITLKEELDPVEFTQLVMKMSTALDELVDAVEKEVAYDQLQQN